MAQPPLGTKRFEKFESYFENGRQMDFYLWHGNGRKSSESNFKDGRQDGPLPLVRKRAKKRDFDLERRLETRTYDFVVRERTQALEPTGETAAYGLSTRWYENGEMGQQPMRTESRRGFRSDGTKTGGRSGRQTGRAENETDERPDGTETGRKVWKKTTLRTCWCLRLLGNAMANPVPLPA